VNRAGKRGEKKKKVSSTIWKRGEVKVGPGSTGRERREHSGGSTMCPSTPRKEGGKKKMILRHFGKWRKKKDSNQFHPPSHCTGKKKRHTNSSTKLCIWGKKKEKKRGKALCMRVEGGGGVFCLTRHRKGGGHYYIPMGRRGRWKTKQFGSTEKKRKKDTSKAFADTQLLTERGGGKGGKG